MKRRNFTAMKQAAKIAEQFATPDPKGVVLSGLFNDVFNCFKLVTVTLGQVTTSSQDISYDHSLP